MKCPKRDTELKECDLEDGYCQQCGAYFTTPRSIIYLLYWSVIFF